MDSSPYTDSVVNNPARPTGDFASVSLWPIGFQSVVLLDRAWYYCRLKWQIGEIID